MERARRAGGGGLRLAMPLARFPALPVMQRESARASHLGVEELHAQAHVAHEARQQGGRQRPPLDVNPST